MGWLAGFRGRKLVSVEYNKIGLLNSDGSGCKGQEQVGSDWICFHMDRTGRLGLRLGWKRLG